MPCRNFACACPLFHLAAGGLSGPEAARDGGKVMFYLSVPPAARAGESNPLLVLLHGGPWTRDSWGFDPWIQYLAAHGYLVLQVNFRGSEGFGYAHIDAARGRFADAAFEDVADALDLVVSRGLADCRRLFVMGASYGGYLALYSAAQNPGKFRAVVSVAGVTDLVDLVQGESLATERDWLAFKIRKALIGDPGKDKDLLRKTSPLHLADRLRDPVLLVHGEDDETVPREHSTRLRRKLQDLGRAVEMVAVPDAKHSDWNPAQSRKILEAIVAFLAQHDPGAGIDSTD